MGILDIHKLKEKPCPEWGKEFVQWAIDTGLMSGDGEAEPTVDNVRPMDLITRLETAVMLYNFFYHVLCESDEPEEVEDMEEDSASWNSYEPQGE